MFPLKCLGVAGMAGWYCWESTHSAQPNAFLHQTSQHSQQHIRQLFQHFTLLGGLHTSREERNCVQHLPCTSEKAGAAELCTPSTGRGFSCATVNISLFNQVITLVLGEAVHVYTHIPQPHRYGHSHSQGQLNTSNSRPRCDFTGAAGPIHHPKQTSGCAGRIPVHWTELRKKLWIPVLVSAPMCCTSLWYIWYNLCLCIEVSSLLPFSPPVQLGGWDLWSTAAPDHINTSTSSETLLNKGLGKTRNLFNPTSKVIGSIKAK